jgi:hypothetical protein
MQVVVYTLCALTSIICAVLLLRGYQKSRARLLLWSSLCFGILAVQNALFFVDTVVVPDHDLSILRNAAGLLGAGVLLFGLVWDAE